MDRYAQMSDIPFHKFEALEARVEALEAAQNLRQQDESAECAAPPNPMDSDLLQHFQEALGDSIDRLRSVYELGRKHGGAASSKPAPAPAGGLVERVRDAMLITQSIEEIARAAIREVAEWLDSNEGLPDLATPKESDGWQMAADVLLKEAKR